MPTATDEDVLSETFAALAHPARRTILARLAQGEAGVKELAAPLDMSLPAVSRHIRVLERAGLLTQGQRAQFRPCTLDASPLRAVSNWTEQYRPVWEDRFDRLQGYLEDIQPPPSTSSRPDPSRPDPSKPDPSTPDPSTPATPGDTT